MKPFALLILVAVGSIGCDAAGDEPMRLILPDMAHSVPYSAYDANPVTGQTLLIPPEGTVPYGYSPERYSPGKEEAERAGTELDSPITDHKAELPRGKQVYDIYCLVCHGTAGEGDGPIIGRFPNPPSLLSPRAKTLPDGHLYHVITHGQGLMAPYALQVKPLDRWRLVTFIRWLQGLDRGGTPPEPTNEEQTQDAPSSELSGEAP
jgi:mono/diheme cytochrome c family protein